MRKLFTFLLVLICIRSNSQNLKSESFHPDSSLIHASVSLCVADASTGDVTIDYNSGISLMPASVLKIITSATALELLGPDYTFKTTIGYTGTLNKRSGVLKGNIVIQGGGDPALGSKYFQDHYGDFLNDWVVAIKKLGIKKIKGKIIADDSYYDYLPVPGKWIWEDIGNYYGAGAYGLSVFDNTYDVHFTTFANGTFPAVKSVIPAEYKHDLTSYLIASGTTDEGYVFSAPYSNKGFIAGSIPSNQLDFILKASITDPPSYLAHILHEKLIAGKVKISGCPISARLEKNYHTEKLSPVTQTISPDLSEIIDVLNHESVNLFAEHLIKELGKKFRNNGSTASGIDVILAFLKSSGVDTNGFFIEDGSGLSPFNSISTRELVRFLVYLRKNGKYFSEFYSSLPDAGKNGTLRNYFTDPVFDTRMKVKSGSMIRVKSFAGYFTTLKGRKMVFSIIINNYSGPSKTITSQIEENIKELIMNN